jgi:hypothetical protein
MKDMSKLSVTSCLMISFRLAPSAILMAISFRPIMVFESRRGEAIPRGLLRGASFSSYRRNIGTTSRVFYLIF